FVTGIAVGLLPLVASAQWSDPTAAPTGGNTPAPINVGSSSQTKSGGLITNSLASNSLLVNGNATATAFCLGSVCLTSWPSGGSTYTGGTGISIAGSVITNSLPTQWTTSGSNIYYNTGNVSVGNGVAPGSFSISYQTAYKNSLAVGNAILSATSNLLSLVSPLVTTSSDLSSGGNFTAAGSITSSNSSNQGQFCIGTSCITAWPTQATITIGSSGGIGESTSGNTTTLTLKASSQNNNLGTNASRTGTDKCFVTSNDNMGIGSSGSDSASCPAGNYMAGWYANGSNAEIACCPFNY
ncbi:MAG TPA: hypothetical protein VMR73_00475, partial [Candidatus Paceibacterota bacterium]|nr:hypothetical protein [Candidatus Paceibacterota bacterium]